MAQNRMVMAGAAAATIVGATIYSSQRTDRIGKPYEVDHNLPLIKRDPGLSEKLTEPKPQEKNDEETSSEANNKKTSSEANNKASDPKTVQSKTEKGNEAIKSEDQDSETSEEEKKKKSK